MSTLLVETRGYVVRRGARTLGFVDVVGAVFVVLAGPRYSHEVEFAQTLIFEEALFALSGDDSTPEQDSLGLDDRPQARSPDDH